MKHFMIKFYFTVIFISLFITQVQAEKAPIKFGKVSLEEMELNTYLPDTTASAVILCDYGVTDMPFSTVEGHFVQTFKRTIRIKILKKEGLDWANFEIPLSKQADNLGSVKGRTYNLEDGKIVKTKMKSDGKFLESVSKYSQTCKLTLPNVKVGSVIEYSYIITSKNIFNIRKWNFQKSIPVKWSEYRVNFPEYFNYKKTTKGYLRFVTNKNEYSTASLPSKKTYSVQRFTWAVSEAPAFKSEPYMTTSSNFLSSIEFEIGSTNVNGVYKNYTSTWEKINTDLLKNESFGLQLKGGGYLKDIVTKINSEAKSEEDKMNMAFDAIKKHMKWNDYNGKYVSSTLRKAFNEKKGNVADINLMLVLLLKKLGLNSDPVILSTRNHGIIFLGQPNISIFNYVVAKIKLNNKDYLLDATEPLCPNNILPFRCINGQGRIIAENGSDWINLNCKMPYKHITSSKLTLNDDGELIGQISDSYQGYAALRTRKYFESKTIDELKISLEENNHGLSLEEFEIINQDDIEKTLQTKSIVEITDKVEDAGDLIYLNPMLYERTKKNPFTLEERKYPVDYGHSYDEIYSIEISLPEGCSLESTPENIRIALPNKAGSYTYSIQSLSGKIILMSRLKITKPMFAFDEYPNLKEFYKLIVAKQAEMIVIKRNS
ncbi:DUF3857 domain-containing protein [Ancylomarina sp. YFZ004]